MIVYVDDILVAAKPVASIEKFKKDFLSCFDARDMGDTYYVLGMEIQIKACREGVCSTPWY